MSADGVNTMVSASPCPAYLHLNSGPACSHPVKANPPISTQDVTLSHIYEITLICAIRGGVEMRKVLVAALCLVAPFFVSHQRASATECKAEVTPDLLDPKIESKNRDLAKGIVCFALPINIEVSVTPTPDDIKAARNIVILAGKIIGNGSPIASAGAKIISPGAPKAAAISAWPSGGSGGASLQKKKLTAEQIHSIASALECRSLALIGDPPPRCGSIGWDKAAVIEMAGKIIGNG